MFSGVQSKGNVQSPIVQNDTKLVEKLNAGVKKAESLNIRMKEIYIASKIVASRNKTES